MGPDEGSDLVDLLSRQAALDAGQDVGRRAGHQVQVGDDAQLGVLAGTLKHVHQLVTLKWIKNNKTLQSVLRKKYDMDSAL